MTSTVKWTARNTKQVRELLDFPDPVLPLAHFIPRRSADMSETLWLNVAHENWPKEVSAAVYDPSTKSYLPVEVGQWIVRHDDNRITVSRKRPDEA